VAFFMRSGRERHAREFVATSARRVYG